MMCCRRCIWHCHPVHLSMDNKYQIIDRSEPSYTMNMFSLPPSLEYYYRQAHPEYMSLPPVKLSQSDPTSKESPMKFLCPALGSLINIPRQPDGSPGMLTCRVAHSDASAELFWHCDGSYIGTTRDIHSMSLTLQDGNHALCVVDSYGNTAKVTFSVL